MSGLPPIDAKDNTMLPAVYRRSDIVRSANVAGRPSLPEGQDAQVFLSNDGVNSGVYKRSRNDSPVVVKTGNPFLKGMIIDVWA
jgi:hypothetical protein